MSGQTIDSRPGRSPRRGETAALEEWPRTPFALSWSGGKDSALALWTLRRQLLEPEALITTITETYERISMHGVRRELLARQAEALRIPLVEVVIRRVASTRSTRREWPRRSRRQRCPPSRRSRSAICSWRMSAPTGRNVLPRPASAASSRSGDAARPISRRSSSTQASRRRSSASTRACSTPPPAGAATTSSLQNSRRASTPAARTASSTPSSPRARSSPSRTDQNGNIERELTSLSRRHRLEVDTECVDLLCERIDLSEGDSVVRRLVEFCR